MEYNIRNYSNYCTSSVKLDLESDITFRDRYGCNGFIRTLTTKYVYITIPLDFVTTFLKESFNLTTITYTFDDILAIFEEMGFKYEYKFINKDIFFLEKHYTGYYVIEIPININYQARYYAFCMIRHFYYDQKILLRYLKIYNYLKNDFEKIITLSIISLDSVGHTFIGRTIPLKKELTFKSLLEEYSIQKTNQLIYGINYRNPIFNSLDYNIDYCLEKIKEYIEIINSNNNGNTIFDNEEALEHFVDDNNKINVSDKSIKLLHKTIKSSIYHSDIAISKNLDYKINSNKPILIRYPCILNTKKLSIFNYYTNLLPVSPKYIINMGKLSRYQVANPIIINDNLIIKKLKNRKFINIISSQEEASNFPLIVLKKNKTLNDVKTIVSSQDELNTYNLKKIVKQPIFKNSKDHYLFFTKKGLFLYQIKLNTHFIDNEMLEFKDHIDICKIVEKKAEDVFNKSGLDIGVVICNVCYDTNAVYISDITPFVNNGLYATKNYLKKINDVCADF